MAAACQMDRSMLYRIISGKRNPPSLNIFRKIAEYLQLAPAEYEQLKNAYDLTRLGMSVYYKRKSVEDFFVHFPSNMASGNVQPLFRDAAFSPELPSSETACIPIFSKTEIDYYAHGILLLEASREKGKIRLLIQPDCPFLFGTLSSLRLYNTLTIDHVICFSRSDQLTSQNQLYTLSYLENMLPLFFADMDYRPYYFYDDVVAHYQNFNGFPCMILTSEYAIVCTSDYQKGFLYKGAKYLQLLHSLYHSYQEKCKQLFEVIRYLPMDGSRNKCTSFRHLMCCSQKPVWCLCSMTTFLPVPYTRTCQTEKPLSSRPPFFYKQTVSFWSQDTFPFTLLFPACSSFWKPEGYRRSPKSFTAL